jgi:hypothetical protein
MWRGGFRLNISVAASFVWRCLSVSTVTPFPHPAHRTGRANLSHRALGQDFTPSPTARRVQAQLSVRARSTRRGARVDKSRPYVARPCAWSATTGATAQRCGCASSPSHRTIRVDFRKILTVHTLCALVGAALGIGKGQNVLAADLVVQGVKPIAGFCLRFRVQRRLQFLNTLRS